MSICDKLIKPEANATINFNTSLISFTFNKPLIVNTRYIYFGLSINKQNINKRLPLNEMNISDLHINFSYKKIFKI